MYGTTKIEAERIVKLAPTGLHWSKRIERNEVRAHSWHEDGSPRTWGIWPIWAYSDRPDLGAQFGGPFVPLDSIETE